MAAPIIRIKRSAVPGKKPTVNDLPLGELGLNTYDAELYARRERTGIGTDIVRLGAGATVTNILYVTAGDPGIGKLRFDNVNISLASLMYIDDQNDGTTDIQPFLRTHYTYK